MPSPTAHIYYGQAFLARHLNHDPGAFLRGTVFPDIRFVVRLERSRTHLLGVSLNDVRAELDPWRAGMLFHCWLDEAWADYFGQWGLDRYDHAYDHKFRALKLMEDDQLQRLLKDGEVEKLAGALGGVDVRALDIGVTADEVQRWNGLIGDLLRQKDSMKAREKMLAELNLTAHQIRELENEERRMARERVWQARVRDCRRVVTGLL